MKYLFTTLIILSYFQLAAAQEFNRNLNTGSRGSDVKELQQLLIEHGFLAKGTKTTGVYGPATRGAIMKFQKSVGIIQNGSFGPKTREAFAKLNKQKKNLSTEVILPEQVTSAPKIESQLPSITVPLYSINETILLFQEDFMVNYSQFLSEVSSALGMGNPFPSDILEYEYNTKKQLEMVRLDLSNYESELAEIKKERERLVLRSLQTEGSFLTRINDDYQLFLLKAIEIDRVYIKAVETKNYSQFFLAVKDAAVIARLLDWHEAWYRNLLREKGYLDLCCKAQ